MTDLVIVGFLVLVAGPLALLLSADTIATMFLFLGIPTIFLCLRNHKNYKRIVLASVTLGLVLGMSYDIVAEFNGAYLVHYNNALLNYHFIGNTPVGDIFWAFLIPFSVLVFYEHFLKDASLTGIAPHYREVLMAGVVLLLSLILFFYWYPDAPRIPFAYLLVGTISVLPLLGLLYLREGLAYKIILVSIFYMAVNLLFELTALTLGQWSFPGQYLAWVTVAGISLPLEEVLLWIVPSAAAIVVCYELFFHDNP